MSEIITRKDALALGLKHYFTGKPCKRGHVCTRNTIDRKCLDCGALNQRKRRLDPFVMERERASDRKAWAESQSRREAKKASDKRRRSGEEYLSEQRASDREKYRSDEKFRASKIRRASAQSKKNRHVLNAQAKKRFSEKYHNDPIFKSSHLLRALVSRVVKAAKTKKTINTFDLLPYTAAQFADHIERQFKKGMTWENHGDWHVDHIVPLDAFIKDGCFDPAIINSLPNMRPIWARQNLSKGSKIETMI